MGMIDICRGGILYGYAFFAHDAVEDCLAILHINCLNAYERENNTIFFKNNSQDARLGKSEFGIIDLSLAKLSGAYLIRADLRGAYLSRVNLSGVDLYGTSLNRVIIDKHNALNLSHADMIFQEWISLKNKCL